MTKHSRIYLFAPAASGKSTFARERQYHTGYKVVDFAMHLPSPTGLTKLILFLSRVIPRLRYLVRNDKAVKAASQREYYKQIFSFLRSEDEPVVVLGRRPPENLDEYKDITFLTVLVSEEIHERNCKGRKGELRNPFPFFNHWTTDFEKLKPVRKQIAEYSKQHNIEIFDSFTAAIASLAEPVEK